MKPYKIPQIKLSYVADREATYPCLNTSAAALALLRDEFDSDEIDYRETFKVVYMNRRNKVVGVHTLSNGGTTATVVDIKMLLTGALLSNAHAIIVAHNHPSGTTYPSIDDDSLTQKIKTGCEAIGIKLLDHVIITSDGHYSYNDNFKL